MQGKKVKGMGGAMDLVGSHGFGTKVKTCPFEVYVVVVVTSIAFLYHR